MFCSHVCIAFAIPLICLLRAEAERQAAIAKAAEEQRELELAAARKVCSIFYPLSLSLTTRVFMIMHCDQVFCWHCAQIRYSHSVYSYWMRSSLLLILLPFLFFC